MKEKFDKKIALDNLDKKKKARQKRQSKTEPAYPYLPTPPIINTIYIDSLMFKKIEVESISNFSSSRQHYYLGGDIFIPGAIKYDNVVIKVYIGRKKFKRLFKIFSAQKAICVQIVSTVKGEEVTWQVHGPIASISNQETDWDEKKELIEFEIIPNTIIKL